MQALLQGCSSLFVRYHLLSSGRPCHPYACYSSNRKLDRQQCLARHRYAQARKSSEAKEMCRFELSPSAFHRKRPSTRNT